MKASLRPARLLRHTILAAVLSLVSVSSFYLGGKAAVQKAPVAFSDSPDLQYNDGLFLFRLHRPTGVDTVTISGGDLVALISQVIPPDEFAEAHTDSTEPTLTAAEAAGGKLAASTTPAVFHKVSSLNDRTYRVEIEKEGFLHFTTSGDDGRPMSIPYDVVMFAGEHQKGLYYPDLNVFSFLLDTETGYTTWSFFFSPSFWQLVVGIALCLLVAIGYSSRRVVAQRNRLVDQNRRLMMARENERERLAAEIHDGPIQDAQYLARELAGMRSGTEASDKPEKRGVEDSIEQLVDRLRDICADLRPPVLYHFGLQDAIRSKVNELEHRYPDVSFVTSLDVLDSIPDDLRIGLFRIAQEALGNAAKHSGATVITTTLSVDRHKILLSVEDNGVGFAPSRGPGRPGNHQGMSLMHHLARAMGSRLRISSQPGRGTSIAVHAMLPQNQESLNAAASLSAA